MALQDIEEFHNEWIVDHVMSLLQETILAFNNEQFRSFFEVILTNPDTHKIESTRYLLWPGFAVTEEDKAQDTIELLANLVVVSADHYSAPIMMFLVVKDAFVRGKNLNLLPKNGMDNPELQGEGLIIIARTIDDRQYIASVDVHDGVLSEMVQRGWVRTESVVDEEGQMLDLLGMVMNVASDGVLKKMKGEE